jgi:GT2 family glycosyltransferase
MALCPKMCDPVPVTAIVTAFRRTEQTLETLRRIEACRPKPDEILVHVDGNELECANAIHAALPHLTLITSETLVGPGGGRNKLIAASRHELIASFDDDSYPVDLDFFRRATLLAEAFPDASLIAANIIHTGDVHFADRKVITRTASFGAGGVIFRRSEFLAAGGFVPLVVAYGMEEEDLALRLLDRGGMLLHSPWLQVYHDTDLARHGAAHITSGSIANVALLAWLRYPPRYWFYGVLQVANRAAWCLKAGRIAGILSGLTTIPAHLARHRHLRRPVSQEAMRQKFAARAAQAISFAPPEQMGG